jgi:hypothetical protein
MLQFCKKWILNSTVCTRILVISCQKLAIIAKNNPRGHFMSQPDFRRYMRQKGQFWPGPNPTIASYNASVVNFYYATGSLARFENKKYFILFWKTL